MGLLYDRETQLEQELPFRLQESLQASLDGFRALCPDCGLVMHRHHRYARSITASYGELKLQIPVFRCRECRNMAVVRSCWGMRSATTAATQKNQ